MARRHKHKKIGRWLLLGGGIVAAIILAVALKEATVKPTSSDGNSGTHMELVDMDPIELGQGLRISRLGAYTGAFMEDGSGDAVSDRMMVILENTGEKDLQLARFSLKYADFSAEFEVSNLPAGASVVALERNRRSASGVPHSAQLSAVLFFPQKMDLMENKLKLTGQKGSLTVENISGADISGDIWVYYKYSATDLFYGGITFRAKLSSGLKAGQSAQVIAGHYDPDGSKTVWVTVDP